jgi:hypothetical protein
MKKCIAILVAVFFVVIAFMPGTVAAAVAPFSYADINPYSLRNGQMVGPYDAVNSNTVTMWYHQHNRS